MNVKNTTLIVVLSDASHRVTSWPILITRAEWLAALASIAREARAAGTSIHGAQLLAGLLAVAYDAKACAALVAEGTP